jgi:hypothetical protein
VGRQFGGLRASVRLWGARRLPLQFTSVQTTSTLCLFGNDCLPSTKDEGEPKRGQQYGGNLGHICCVVPCVCQQKVVEGVNGFETFQPIWPRM